jgi:hypothetical protein
MKNFVWLNIKTGKFSDSWDEKTQNNAFTKEELKEHGEKHPDWKLIQYECITDPEFVFNHRMTIKNIK